MTTAGDKPLVVEKSGETEWKLVEPSRGTTKEGRVADMLLTLRSAQVEGDRVLKGDDAAKWGLDKPELEVTAGRPAAPSWARSWSGKRDGAVTYVKLKAEPGDLRGGGQAARRFAQGSVGDTRINARRGSTPFEASPAEWIAPAKRSREGMAHRGVLRAWSWGAAARGRA